MLQLPFTSEGDFAIDAIDHFVMTVADIEATTDFYRRVLNMDVLEFAPRRLAVRFGRQKINLHVRGAEITPNARAATPGSADFCLITRSAIAAVVRRLEREGVAIEEGPLIRSGAVGAIESCISEIPTATLSRCRGMSLLRNERGLRGDRTDSPRVAFYQVDTFTTKVFTGNPAGVVLNGVSLTRSQMQRIARELNNSETAFVLPGNGDGEPVHVDVGERAVIAYRGELALR